MSSTLAIAAVTASFSQLLGRVIEEPSLTGASVSTRAPDLARTETAADRQLNLFLYGIAPNAAARNRDLPLRSSDGTLVGQPVLALDLNYVVTAYGQDNDDLDAHHLLGQAMSLVADQGFLDRALIRGALGTVTGHPELAGSDLADEVEPVRLTPLPMTEEDLFRLWSVFGAQYRISVGYRASLVLVARPHSPRPALPVRESTVTVTPSTGPVLERVDPAQLTAGASLTLHGRGFAAGPVQVTFSGGESVTPDAAGVTDTTVRVALPPTLQPGAHTVQVVGLLSVGDPPAPHAVGASQALPVLVAPRIVTPAPLTVARGQTLDVEVAPAVGRAQAVELLLGDLTIAIPARPIAGPASTTALSFPIPADAAAGPQLVRVSVDGVPSALDVEADPGSPDVGRYVGPVVTVT